MKNFRNKLTRSPWIFAIALCLLGTGCATSSSNQVKPLSQKDHFTLLLELAAANLTENDATNGLITLNQAREINDHDADLYYLYALAYFQKHEPRLAIESARRSLHFKPDYSKVKNTLGKLLMDQGNFVEAEKYLKEAASDLTYSEAFIAKSNLGILYYKKMNYPAAEQWLSSAIEDGGDGACVAAYYRGLLYSNKNDLEHARRDFNRASKNSCSLYMDAHLAEGKTLMRMKKYEQARAKFLELQQLFPDTDAANKANDYLREIP